jgi:hypothetical protein
MTQQGSWGTARIYYYERDKTNLLLDAVKPIIDQCPREVRRAYFVRHWICGSHIRVRFEVDPVIFARVIEPLVLTVAGDYLAVHPSQMKVDPAEQLRQHKRLAILEREQAALTPLVADNCILFDPPVSLRRPDSDSMEYLLSDFYADTTPLVFRTLEEIRAGSASQNDFAFDAMIAVAHRFYPSPRDASIKEGFVSFRSHSEAYIATTPNHEAVRRHFDLQSEKFVDVLSDRVLTLVSELDSGDTSNPLLNDWLVALRTWMKELIARRSSELFYDDASRAIRPWGGDWVSRSEFHQAIAGSAAYRSLLFDSPWFREYRLALNLTYLHLNRIGLLPIERYLLCHLLADAVERTYAISALALVGKFSSR